jgi:5'-3' exonuclease
VTTLLIDADLIVFRSCIAVERDLRIDEMDDEMKQAVSHVAMIPSDDPSFHVLYSDFREAWENVELEMRRLFEHFRTDKHIACLSAGRNFRYDVDPTYKGNRKDTRKPLAFHRIREELAKQYTVKQFDGLEADDLLGIFATRNPDTIICSADKDLKTIPGALWNGDKLLSISEGDANLWFYTQVLTGDTADGYPGCKGIGPKKAEAILKDAAEDIAVHGEGSLWKAVVATYEQYGFTADDALRQARLARILRSSDWDAKAKKPILWTPPS